MKLETAPCGNEREQDSEMTHSRPGETALVKPLTDLGNAERLVERCRGSIHYNLSTKGYLIYREGRWQPDPGPEMYRLAYETVKKIPAEAEGENIDSTLKEQLVEHARRSESKGRIKAILELARWFPEVAVAGALFNSDPWLLNCLNGTLNLRTRVLQPHRAEDMITAMIRVPYDPEARCPGWERFLSRITAGDTEKAAFLRRMAGYFLTGLTWEQCLFLFYGSGANGKTTFIEMLRELMADYAMHTATSSLLHSSSSAIRNDLARLSSARLVTAVELAMGKRFDEALIKQVTGGDPLTTRFLYQEFFEFKPQFKLVIAANHKPEIRGVDNGIWRRVHLIPFEVTIPEAEADRALAAKLRNELPGILAWAVRGCFEWQEHGLMVPASIRDATVEYRAEMDVLENFFEDRCSKGPEKRTPVGDLFAHYESWAKANCQEPLGKKVFGSLMRQKGYTQFKSGSTRFWKGLEVIQQA